MLAADAYLQIGSGRTASLRTHLHKLPNAFLIQHLERIVGQDLVLQVERQELT